MNALAPVIEVTEILLDYEKNKIIKGYGHDNIISAKFIVDTT